MQAIVYVNGVAAIQTERTNGYGTPPLVITVLDESLAPTAIQDSSLTPAQKELALTEIAQHHSPFNIPMD